MPGWKSAYSNVERLSRYALVAAVVILISFLYPGSIRFKYEFQKGQIWKYDNLIAPFDFAIKKPEQEVREDKDRVLREFPPCYRRNTELGALKRSNFEAAFENRLKVFTQDNQSLDVVSRPERYMRLGVRLLDNFYNKGVILLHPEHRNKGKDFVISLLEGNTITKRTLPGFFSPEEAERAIQDSLKKSGLTDISFLQPLLEEALAANIFYDDELTQKLRAEALAQVVTTKGLVRQGETIVTKGTVITDAVFEKLVSFREQYETDVASEMSGWVVYGGYLLLTALILWVFMMYVQSYRREILQRWNYLLFILMWLLVFSYLTFLVEKIDSVSAYVIPYCIVPVIVRHFFTYRLAFFTHVVVVLIAGLLTSLGYQFIFMQILAGVVAVLAVADARDWTKFFKSVLYILLTYLVAYIGLSLVEEGNLSDVNWSVNSWLFFNGLLTLLAFPLIPLMERTFGFISSISLVELSDLNRPLLRDLSMKAPGTMQHSLQVANLGEAAAHEIGANALLVRVGALYHDVGKMLKPEFFVENQTNVSPHENLNHTESAAVIISHVTEGAKLAKKAHLPQRIIDFIYTHHGTTKVEYFYRSFLKENPGVDVDESLFTYPGPRPRTREEAIVMLADSVEATSRSLKNPTGKDIDELVDNTIGHKIEKGQLDSSTINFGDVETCRQVFKKMLRSIYHIRMEYPKEVKE